VAAVTSGIRLACQTYSWQMSIATYRGQVAHMAAVADTPRGLGAAVWTAGTVSLGGALVCIAAQFMLVFRAAAAIGLCGVIAFVVLVYRGNEYDMKTYPFLALGFFGIVAAT